VLSPEQLRRTAATIAAQQLPCGAIPWPDGHTDAWDHVECAMALVTAGDLDGARAAYDWLLETQAEDGSWATSWAGLDVLDPMVDVNQCAYVAVGAWHWWLSTGDRALVTRLWPAVRAALDLVLRMQASGGEVFWAREADGRLREEALLTGSASIHQSLRCGLALADLLGEAPRPDWELAVGRLQHVVAHHPEAFLDKSRFSMDWYYPVLGGAVRGTAGRAHLAAGWDSYVVADLGVRCVSDRPWVTGAETAECALAFLAVGLPARARDLLASAQHLRAADGSYWTGLVYDEDVRWPEERSSWTAAAMVLASDALAGGVAAELFGGAGLPAGLLLPVDACERDACTVRRAG
jgi:hypothetical protein